MFQTKTVGQAPGRGDPLVGWMNGIRVLEFRVM